MQQVTTQGTRSSALQPLNWVLGIVLTSFTGCIAAKAPLWVLVGVGLAAAAVLVVTMGAYTYLLICDRDALRSENFSLSKMAIQKGLVGDSVNGLISASAISEENTRLAQQGNDSGLLK